MLSYRKKIFIDRTFGMLAAILMKVLTRLVGMVLHRDHSLPENPKVIAVAKFVGLGSTVYTGILCRALKERFPNTKLVYITSCGSLELVKRINYINEILWVNDKNIMSMVKSTAFLILRLWRLRPALYFDMEVYSTWAAVIATLSLALNRYGFYRKNSEFKKGMHTHMVFFNTRQHISQIYSQLALCVGSKANRDLSGILNISGEDRGFCSQILKETGAENHPTILVNTNASELLRERRWPAEKWIEYLEQTVNKFPEFRFLLVGAPNESEYVSALYNNLSSKARQKVLNVAGRFTLGAFLALIEKASLMVTNDSGPFHLAVTLGTPTVSVWGPGDPEHYGAINGLHKIIYKPVYCSPCLYHADRPPCEGNNVCVKNIPVSSVFEATKETIEAIKDGNSNKKKLPSTIPPINIRVISSSSQREEFNPLITHRKRREN